MLLLTLIAILSIGIVEGLDPYKGLLFSYYFYSFKKVKESYIIPAISTTAYYLIGIIIYTLISINNDTLTRIMILYLLVTHGLIKLMMGKILHYTGNMKPKMLNLLQWSILNSIIQMNVILLLALTVFFRLSPILLLIFVIVIRELMFCLSMRNNKILLTLTKYNFDYFYLISLFLICVLIILPLL